MMVFTIQAKLQMEATSDVATDGYHCYKVALNWAFGTLSPFQNLQELIRGIVLAIHLEL